MAHLMPEADRRAALYLASVDERDVFPNAEALEGLARFDEPLPEDGTSELSTGIARRRRYAGHGHVERSVLFWLRHRRQPAGGHCRRPSGSGVGMSVSSWRTRDEDIDAAVSVLASILAGLR